MNHSSVGFHAVVRGRVQGVGFRWFTRRKAEGLSLSGWVRNLADGTVEVYFHGDMENMASMKAYLAKGPMGARVDDLSCREIERDDLADGFIVRESVVDENHA